ncbi:hypothetical protein CDAR_402151 [Caerostris darwini]|uniref:Uncharacterized protein n=1 Tax=Caerostris darwini TaxID=1538125 RepID=A0AAV4T112_9ARAC|nr:hypothetical protein CDAR_402151 [Caerostris darwini]
MQLVPLERPTQIKNRSRRILPAGAYSFVYGGEARKHVFCNVASAKTLGRSGIIFLAFLSAEERVNVIMGLQLLLFLFSLFYKTNCFVRTGYVSTQLFVCNLTTNWSSPRKKKIKIRAIGYFTLASS